MNAPNTSRNPDDVKAIGTRIRTLRTDKGLSLTELAERAGVSKSYLSTVEHGTGSRPGVAVLHKLATALGVTLADILGRVVQSTPTTVDVPESLQEFAEANNLPQVDIDMLAGIKFRGDAPRTAARWQFIYNAIVMSGQVEERPG
ncbi:helix-turn-helix domain-containing protein [Mumia zhuanghuii]|uniref:Helix-turn-helix domain-containing protein n=2 Tax=Mumia TaxID=1546255 RepID=A0ABW1QHL0_9ACTN|nr:MULTISPECIES: helix-turn-helix domain-containing protein [Mumia]KAA1418138.1 helix-turn-helix domain-containing protein [Mumia zhuanghuii]